MNIQDKLRLQYVKRWHTVAMDHQQSVADHTINVVFLAMEIAARMGDVNFSVSTFLYALHHDIDEVNTGDITPSAKRCMPDHVVQSLSPVATNYMVPVSPLGKSVVKWADRIDTLRHIVQHGVGYHAYQVADALQEEFLQCVREENNKALAEAVVGLVQDLMRGCNYDWRIPPA